jgi:hypothetical protein
MVTSEIDRGRDQEVVTSRNPAEYCVTYIKKIIYFIE